MGVHRFRFQGCQASQLSKQTANGGTLQNFFPNFLDVDLNNDADLPDLEDFLGLSGFEFVESVPTFPPNNWQQPLSFSAPLISLPSTTDVFFGLSGAGLGTIGATGLVRDLLPFRAGRVDQLVLRSSLAVTVDVFVTIDATRTVIAGAVALASDDVTPVTPTAFPAWAVGEVVQMGVHNTGSGVSPDLTVGVGVRWA